MNHYRFIQFLLLILIALTSCQQKSEKNPTPPLTTPHSASSAQSNSSESLVSTANGEEEYHGLYGQWIHPTTGLHWGQVIIEGSPYLQGSEIADMGWLFFEARSYCQERQARLPTLIEWRELLESIGAQSDAPFGVAPISFNSPTFLSSGASNNNDRLNYIWLDTPAADIDGDMTIYNCIAHRQNGTLMATGHRNNIPFVCVW